MKAGTYPPRSKGRGKVYYDVASGKVLYNTGRGWVPIKSKKKRPSGYGSNGKKILSPSTPATPKKKSEPTPEERFDRAEKAIYNV